MSNESQNEAEAKVCESTMQSQNKVEEGDAARVLGLILTVFAVVESPAIQEKSSQEPCIVMAIVSLEKTVPKAMWTYRFVSSYCWVTRWTST